MSQASVLHRYDSLVRSLIRIEESSIEPNGASANKRAKETPIRANSDGLPPVFLAKDSETTSFDMDCFCCK